MAAPAPSSSTAIADRPAQPSAGADSRTSACPRLFIDDLRRHAGQAGERARVEVAVADEHEPDHGGHHG
ncbi:MAG: hypothetical protein LC808_02260, partial [Actinobacteria bacterium]|nr:hypothetical protein [Actinomycetota bacterium]